MFITMSISCFLVFSMWHSPKVIYIREFCHPYPWPSTKKTHMRLFMFHHPRLPIGGEFSDAGAGFNSFVTPELSDQKNQSLETPISWYGCFLKWWVFPQNGWFKFHGKPYEQMDDLGGKTHYFRNWNIHILEGRDSHIGDSIPPRM